MFTFPACQVRKVSRQRNITCCCQSESEITPKAGWLVAWLTDSVRMQAHTQDNTLILLYLWLSRMHCVRMWGDEYGMVAFALLRLLCVLFYFHFRMAIIFTIMLMMMTLFDECADDVRWSFVPFVWCMFVSLSFIIWFIVSSSLQYLR